MWWPFPRNASLGRPNQTIKFPPPIFTRCTRPILWSTTHNRNLHPRQKPIAVQQLPVRSRMSSEPTEPQPPAKPPPVRYQPTPRRPPQPPPPAKKEIVIGGLKVFVYGLDKVKDEIPRVVLFLLHGRGGDHTQFEEFIESLDLKSINRNRTRRQLYAPGGVKIVLI